MLRRLLVACSLLTASTAPSRRRQQDTNIPFDLDQEYGPNFRKSYSEQAARLRSHLLAGYDKRVPPTANRTNTYSKAGTDVELQIRFFKVDAISQVEGSMALKIWMRMAWSAACFLAAAVFATATVVQAQEAP